MRFLKIEFVIHKSWKLEFPYSTKVEKELKKRVKKKVVEDDERNNFYLTEFLVSVGTGKNRFF